MVGDLLTWRIGSCSVEFIYPLAHGRAGAHTMEMLIGGAWRPAASGRAEAGKAITEARGEAWPTLAKELR